MNKQLAIFVTEIAISATGAACFGKLVYDKLPDGKIKKGGRRRKKYKDLPDEEVFPEDGTLEL